MGEVWAEIIDANTFDSIRKQWNSLLSNSSADSIFLSWEWVHTWWKTFGSGKELWLISIKDGGDLIGIAPFYVDIHLRPLGIRIARICSSVELYPDHLDIISRLGREKDVALCILDHLKTSKKSWDVLICDGLPENSILLNYWDSTYRGWVRDVKKASLCPYLKIECGYEQFEKMNFKQKKRYNLNRQIKRVMEGEDTRAELLDDESIFEKRMMQLFHLHSQRAKQKGIQSTFDRRKQIEFHLAFGRLMLKDGKLVLFSILKGEVPVSSIYGFIHDKRLYFYQSGMDPAWEKMSIGSVVLSLLIKKAFEDRLDEFDFLKGDERYKSVWATGVRREFRLTVYRNCFKGWLTLSAAEFQRRARKAGRRGLEAVGLARRK